VRELLLLGDEVMTKICVVKDRGAGKKVSESPCDGGTEGKDSDLNGCVWAPYLTTRCVLPVGVRRIEMRQPMGCHIKYRVENQIK